MNLLNLFIASAMAFGTAPKPSPSPVFSPVPLPTPKVFVEVFNYGKSVDKAYAMEAVALLNKAHSSGCIERKVLTHNFKSLHTVFSKDPQTRAEAYAKYTANIPHRVDLRWYYQPNSKTIGYTYNFDNIALDGKTETKIFTNTINLRTTGQSRNVKFYASHLAHEISHQAQAGGFVHYSFHQGSFPYEIGDIVYECLTE